MSDIELLELAAKAAGYNWQGLLPDHGFWPQILDESPLGNRFVHWNPLTDDGDALRLAVKLNMFVRCGEFAGVESPVTSDGSGNDEVATRRAIVRAAAEIGRAMP